ncbi:MAG: hypothetical protein U0176_25795 [Bacteroidia bacterium]
MRIILCSWGLMILWGFIGPGGLHAQQSRPIPADAARVTMLQAEFRTIQALAPGKWMEAHDFSWQGPGNIRLEAKQPLLLKWNAAQDSLFLDTIPGRGREYLAISGTDLRFGGQFLLKNGSLTGKANFAAPGMVVESGILEVNDLGLTMSESNLRFQSLDSSSTLAEIDGGFEYHPQSPNQIIVRPRPSSATKLCGGRWFSVLDAGIYDLQRHELSYSTPKDLMKQLFVAGVAISPGPDVHRLDGYAVAAQLNILLDSGLVHASKTSDLWVADAQILLPNRRFTLDRNGVVRPLKEVTVQLDVRKGLHYFENTDVTFLTCSTYVARGFCPFIVADGQEQFVTMDLKLQGDTMTIAHGEIEGPGFFLNDGFQYRGSMDIDSWHEEIRCKGNVQVNLRHPFFQERWFPINQWIDPGFVVLDLFSSVNRDSNLSCGLHLDSLFGPYPTFVGKKYHPGDPDLLRAWGSMAYDGQRRAFSIGNRELLLGQDHRGCAVHFTIDSTNVIAEGPIQLPAEWNPIHAGLECMARAKEVAAEHEVKITLTGTVDLKALPRHAIQEISDRSRISLALNETFDPMVAGMRVALANLLDPDLERKPVHYRKFVQASESSPNAYELNLGEHLPFSALAFSIPDLRWDPQFSSLWQSGPIAILSAGGAGVNKFTSSNTKTELRRILDPNGGPAHAELRMYIEFDEVNWVYFHFTPDGLSFGTSLVDLMNELRKEKTRKANKLTLLTEEDKDRYLVNFVNTYIWRTGR